MHVQLAVALATLSLAVQAQSFEADTLQPQSRAAATADRSVGLPLAQGTARVNSWKDSYRWSVAAVSLATAADLASSLKFSADGQKEANPLLRSAGGAYSARGAAIEAGLVGGSLILQRYLVHKHPSLRLPFLVSNYALAGLQVFNVSHNVKY